MVRRGDVTLRGITWDHPRGLEPLVATARRYAREHPGVRVVWDHRSLQAFGDQPVDTLAETYDLLVIDHPHVGDIAETGCLLPLDTVLPAEQLQTLRNQSVGRSHLSYQYAGHQWALAIDAAAQVAAYRPDLLAAPPTGWPEVLALAKRGDVLWPLKPVDAMCSFLTLVVSSGAACPHTEHTLVDRTAGVAALELMAEARRHLPDECLRMSPIDVLDRLASGDGAAYSPLLFGYSNYARRGFRPHLLGFRDIPTGDRPPDGSILGGAGLAVSARCADPVEAARYAAWAAAADVQRTTYVEAGGQPANAVAWSDPTVDELCSGFFSATRRSLEGAWVRPRQPGYVELQRRGGEVLHAFLRRGGDPSDVVARLNALHQETRR